MFLTLVLAGTISGIITLCLYHGIRKLWYMLDDYLTDIEFK